MTIQKKIPDFYTGRFLSASEFEDGKYIVEDVNLEIIVNKHGNEEEKVSLKLKGFVKHMILNKTNFNALVSKYGDINNVLWKEIEILVVNFSVNGTIKAGFLINP